MCVPDLRGSQGTFSLLQHRDARDGEAAFAGRRADRAAPRQGRPRSARGIVGPDNALLRSGGRMTLPFTLEPAADGRSARARDRRHASRSTLRARRVHATGSSCRSRPGSASRCAGIARFYLISRRARGRTLHDADPHRSGAPGDADQPSRGVRDLPREEAGPVRDARARRGHLGAQRARDRREGVPRAGDVLLRGARADVPRRDRADEAGLVTTVFDTTDRVQHMFYRYLDPTHPANAGKDTERVEGRDRRRCTSASTRCSARSGTWSTTRTPCSW